MLARERERKRKRERKRAEKKRGEGKGRGRGEPARAERQRKRCIHRQKKRRRTRAGPKSRKEETDKGGERRREGGPKPDKIPRKIWYQPICQRNYQEFPPKSGRETLESKKHRSMKIIAGNRPEKPRLRRAQGRKTGPTQTNARNRTKTLAKTGRKTRHAKKQRSCKIIAQNRSRNGKKDAKTQRERF